MPAPELDLNALRETILRNQSAGRALPDQPAQQVLVDREGCIVLTDHADRGEERTLSVVHQGVFAAH